MKSIVFFNLAHHVLLEKSANQRAEMGLDRDMAMASSLA